MRYGFTSSALVELRQAVMYYEEKEKGLGRVLLDEIDATVARVLINPDAWRSLSSRTRRWRWDFSVFNRRTLTSFMFLMLIAIRLI